MMRGKTRFVTASFFCAWAVSTAGAAMHGAGPRTALPSNDLDFTVEHLNPHDDTGPSSEAAPRGAFDIVIAPNAALAADPAALAAFDRAAAQWESRIHDPITVTIDAGLADLGAETLGTTNVRLFDVGPYALVRAHWIANADGDDDLLAFLPDAPVFTVPAGFGVSGDVRSAKAGLKAIGGFGDLDAQEGALDASILFNTQIPFDFDRSDGITPNTIDFESAAAHEIGHALGFVSSVDEIDASLDLGQTTTVTPTTLDHFRFLNESTSDPANASGFSTFPRDLRTNVNAVSDFISALRFEGVENRMSTGRFSGDGHPAGHWKSEQDTGIAIGLMDPMLPTGTISPISDADLRALDLIGYDIILLPDCDADGTPDADNIAQGAPDCNANEVPDACDISQPALTTHAQSMSVAIPDNIPAGAASTLTIPDSATIADLDVRLRINHTWQGDLVVTLSHAGLTQTLIDRPGADCIGNDGFAANNFGAGGHDLVLDDAAPVDLDCYYGTGRGNAGLSNYAGPARPTQALSAFNGLDAAGDWTLTVSDHFPGQAGALVSWGLDVRIPTEDCNANGTPDECEAGCPRPPVSVVGASSRKANPAGPDGWCAIELMPGVRTEPRQGGVTEVRIAFDGAPGGPGLNPVALRESTCAVPGYAPYAGAAAVSAMIAGHELVLAFNPALENARTYRIELGNAISSIPGQFVEVRALRGDVNHNGLVNGNDRSAVIGAWTSPGSFSCETDLNASGLTNGNDRSIVIGAWTGTGTHCAP